MFPTTKHHRWMYGCEHQTCSGHLVGHNSGPHLHMISITAAIAWKNSNSTGILKSQEPNRKNYLINTILCMLGILGRNLFLISAGVGVCWGYTLKWGNSPQKTTWNFTTPFLRGWLSPEVWTSYKLWHISYLAQMCWTQWAGSRITSCCMTPSVMREPHFLPPGNVTITVTWSASYWLLNIWLCKS